MLGKEEPNVGWGVKEEECDIEEFGEKCDCIRLRCIEVLGASDILLITMSSHEPTKDIRKSDNIKRRIILSTKVNTNSIRSATTF